MPDDVSRYRLAAFVVIFVVMAVSETVWPRHTRLRSRGERWTGNLLLTLANGLVQRVMLPISAAVVAMWAQSHGWGLLNLVEWPLWVGMVASLVALDLLIYWQHVITHKVPVLWRMHRVHHADVDLDATTGLRFHSIEIALSTLWKGLWIVLLGAPWQGVVLFEVILNGLAMFNHANVRMPVSVDRWLRRLIVTPRVHEIHHSQDPAETNSNYGFNLVLWDRLFGTYIDQPQAGTDGLRIGLEQYDQAPTWLFGWILTNPFRSDENTTELTDRTD